MNLTIDIMITIIIVGLIAIILLISWRFESGRAAISPKDIAWKIPVWLVIALLSVFVIVFPRIRNKINEIQNKNSA